MRLVTIEVDDWYPDEAVQAARDAFLEALENASVGHKWRIHRPEVEGMLLSAAGPRITDDYLATLAWAYVDILGYPKVKVVPELADMLNRPANTIRMHLVRARDRGFLTGEVGKAAGVITDKARKILEEKA